MATMSTSSSSSALRNTNRPMRPKPLIAIFFLILLSPPAHALSTNDQKWSKVYSNTDNSISSGRSETKSEDQAYQIPADDLRREPIPIASCKRYIERPLDTASFSISFKGGAEGRTHTGLASTEGSTAD